jgi:hypothetical protein
MLLHQKAKRSKKIITEAIRLQAIDAYIKIKIQNLSMTIISANLYLMILVIQHRSMTSDWKIAPLV